MLHIDRGKVADPTYYDIQRIDSTLFTVDLNENAHQLMNSDGEIIIDDVFSDIDFVEDLILIKRGVYWRLYDRLGQAKSIESLKSSILGSGMYV